MYNKPMTSRSAVSVALLLALLLAGCETTELREHLPPAPAAALGPAFEVAHAQRYGSSIGGTVDGSGRAHLIIVAKTADQSEIKPGINTVNTEEITEIRYVVVGPQGVERDTVIRSGCASPCSSDLAFDRAGVLHAVIGGEHLVLKDGVWKGQQRTPWQEAHITPGDAMFVHGMPDLTWAFKVQNKDLGLPDRTHLPAAAQPDTSKLVRYEPYARTVVVPEETPYRWYALSLEDDLDVRSMQLAADRQGAIHAFYAPETWPQALRYAVFRLDGCRDPGPNAWFKKRAVVPRLDNGMVVCPVLGSSVTEEQPPTDTPAQDIGPRILIGPKKFALVSERHRGTSLAMDPDTGSVLMVGGNLYSVQAGQTPTSQVAKVPVRDAGMIVGAAGNGRFHALLTGVSAFSQHPRVYYLAYAQGAWSAPVEIGRYSYSYFSHAAPDPVEPGRDSFRIIGGSNGRALLIWPLDDIFMARWVTLQ